MKLTSIKYFILNPNTLFSGVQGFFCAANAMYFSFLVVYLSDHGYSASIIGLTLTLVSLINIVFQPVLGYLCDNVITYKKVMITCMLISIPTAFLLPIFIGIPALGMISILTFSIFEFSLPAVIDSWTVSMREKYQFIDYGVTRSFGSLFYSFSVLLISPVLQKIGLDKMYYFYVLFISLGALCAFLLEETPCANKVIREQSEQPTVKQESALKQSAKILLKNKAYIILLVATTITNIGFKAMTTFYSNIIGNVGGTTSHLGLALFVMAISEVPVMVFYKKFTRFFSAKLLFSVSLFFMILRVFSVAIPRTIEGLLWVQLFESLSYGLYVPAFLEYVSSIVPTNINATAVTLAASITSGLSAVIGNFAGGVLIDTIGIYKMVYVAGTLCVIGFVVFLLSSITVKKRNDSYEKL